jgi:hypothetical protein
VPEEGFGSPSSFAVRTPVTTLWAQNGSAIPLASIAAIQILAQNAANGKARYPERRVARGEGRGPLPTCAPSSACLAVLGGSHSGSGRFSGRPSPT